MGSERIAWMDPKPDSMNALNEVRQAFWLIGIFGVLFALLGFFAATLPHLPLIGALWPFRKYLCLGGQGCLGLVGIASGILFLPDVVVGFQARRQSDAILLFFNCLLFIGVGLLLLLVSVRWMT